MMAEHISLCAFAGSCSTQQHVSVAQKPGLGGIKVFDVRLRVTARQVQFGRAG